MSRCRRRCVGPPMPIGRAWVQLQCAIVPVRGWFGKACTVAASLPPKKPPRRAADPHAEVLGVDAEDAGVAAAQRPPSRAGPAVDRGSVGSSAGWKARPRLRTPSPSRAPVHRGGSRGSSSTGRPSVGGPPVGDRGKRPLPQPIRPPPKKAPRPPKAPEAAPQAGRTAPAAADGPAGSRQVARVPAALPAQPAAAHVQPRLIGPPGASEGPPAGGPEQAWRQRVTFLAMVDITETDVTMVMCTLLATTPCIGLKCHTVFIPSIHDELADDAHS